MADLRDLFARDVPLAFGLVATVYLQLVVMPNVAVTPAALDQ